MPARVEVKLDQVLPLLESDLLFLFTTRFRPLDLQDLETAAIPVQ